MSLLPEDFFLSPADPPQERCAHPNTEKTGTAFLLPAKFKKKGRFLLVIFLLSGGTLYTVAVYLEYSCGRKLREQYADDFK